MDLRRHGPERHLCENGHADAEFFRRPRSNRRSSIAAGGRLKHLSQDFAFRRTPPEGSRLGTRASRSWTAWFRFRWRGSGKGGGM